MINELLCEKDMRGVPIIKMTVSCITVAINELLCMKNAGAQIAMDFS